MDFFEFIKDFTDSAKDRIKTPITGSFTLAFIVYNWMPLSILLFSKSSIEYKIAFINMEYCNVWALIIPLVVAIVYVIGVPYIMMGLEKATRVALKGRKEHKSNQKLKDLELLEGIYAQEFKNTRIKNGNITEEASIAERDALKATVAQLTDQLGKTTELNVSLSKTIDSLERELRQKEIDYESTVNKLNSDLSESEARSERIIERSKTVESSVQTITEEANEYKNEYNAVAEQINNYNNVITNLLDNSDLKKILVQLSLDEQEQFVTFYSINIKGNSGPPNLPFSPILIEKFIELNLIFRRGEGYDYHKLGKMLFDFLNDQAQIPSFDKIYNM
jgi:hypothetical protein